MCYGIRLSANKSQYPISKNNKVSYRNPDASGKGFCNLAIL